MITYLCKYTPLELLAALGAELSQPNRNVRDFRNADARIHSSVCSHAKILLEECIAGEASGNDLVLTNCCDSVRRVYDTVASDEEIREKLRSMEMLDLPHTSYGHAVDAWCAELIRFRDRFIARTGHSFDRQLFLKLWKEQADNWAVFSERGSFIAIMGARVSDELRTRIRDTMPFPVIDLTCGGLRTMPAPPGDAFVRSCDGCRGDGAGSGAAAPAACADARAAAPAACVDNGAAAPVTFAKGAAGAQPAEDSGYTCTPSNDAAWKMDDDALIHAYAQALLTQIPCTRMEDLTARDRLLETKGLVGIVYHSVKFCDYYAFEYADIRGQTELPVLKIETDYTSQSEGQLDTRMKAFAETLGENSEMKLPWTKEKDQKKKSRQHANNAENAKESAKVVLSSSVGDGVSDIYVGIDSGSTSTNVAAISADGRLLASSIVRTGARAGASAKRAFEDVKQQLGRNASRIRRVIATGYGREFIDFADSTKTEISCHARGAHFSDPEARCIIDIGGQDSKVICLDEDGNVMNFVMNDKCAAGTGRFLEMMAHTLETDLASMSTLGLKWKKDLTISSTCTVFAESEVVSLIAENTDPSDIVHALNKSVAGRTCGMVRRVRGSGPYMMTGGVARNKGVTNEISARLEAPLSIVEHPDLVGAIGAALFAME